MYLRQNVYSTKCQPASSSSENQFFKLHNWKVYQLNIQLYAFYNFTRNAPKMPINYS